MNTSCTFIGDQRRAASKRLHHLSAALIGIAILACFIVASNADFADAALQEQRVADIACRAAGATAAVRVDALGASIFICNKPVAGALARSAI